MNQPVHLHISRPVVSLKPTTENDLTAMPLPEARLAVIDILENMAHQFHCMSDREFLARHGEPQ